MPDIPAIRHKPVSTMRQLKRGTKTSATEKNIDKSPAEILPVDRRHNQDRRQKQIKVAIDRRRRGLIRRKKDSALITAAKPDILTDTIGKHINTTA